MEEGGSSCSSYRDSCKNNMIFSLSLSVCVCVQEILHILKYIIFKTPLSLFSAVQYGPGNKDLLKEFVHHAVVFPRLSQGHHRITSTETAVSTITLIIVYGVLLSRCDGILELGSYIYMLNTGTPPIEGLIT